MNLFFAKVVVCALAASTALWALSMIARYL